MQNVGASIQAKQMSHFHTSQLLQRWRGSPSVLCICATNVLLCHCTLMCFQTNIWSFLCYTDVHIPKSLRKGIISVCCLPCACPEVVEMLLLFIRQKCKGIHIHVSLRLSSNRLLLRPQSYWAATQDSLISKLTSRWNKVCSFAALLQCPLMTPHPLSSVLVSHWQVACLCITILQEVQQAATRRWFFLPLVPTALPLPVCVSAKCTAADPSIKFWMLLGGLTGRPGWQGVLADRASWPVPLICTQSRVFAENPSYTPF